MKKKQYPGQGKVDDRKHSPKSKVDDRKHPPGGSGVGGGRGVGGVGPYKSHKLIYKIYNIA